MYRFKNEYRLFIITIVRYNYGYYNTPAEPLNLTCMQGLSKCTSRQALKTSELPGGHKTARKFLKNLKAGDRRETGGKKARKE